MALETPSTDFELLRFASSSSPTNTTCSHSCPETYGSISLNNDSTWTHCGALLDLTSLPQSFYTWANATVNGDLEPRLLPFLSFVHAFLAHNQLYHYWLTLRASRATHEFDLPRWHTDRNFFDHEGDKEHWKLCTTLVGPGTLFLSEGPRARMVQARERLEIERSEAGNHQCQVVRCIGCAGMQEAVRLRLAEKLQDDKVIQAAAGECAFFRVGDETGAMHSEPPNHGDRVFVNVVPGTELELKRLTSRWGMEFPRSWSIGVPLNSVLY